MGKFLMRIHQLPQILLGKWAVRHYGGIHIHSIKDVDVYKVKGIDGMSLGNVILIDPDVYEGTWLIKHEYGHVIQSRILGWLYIPIIFIPSFLWYQLICWLERILKWEQSYSTDIYYKFYTESWANRLVK